MYVRRRTAHDAKQVAAPIFKTDPQSLESTFFNAEALRRNNILVIIKEGATLKMDSSKFKICYVITEKGGKSYFNRIGVAFVNSDGSLNVKLEAFPVNGELHIRDYVPRGEERKSEELAKGDLDDIDKVIS